MPDPTTLSGFIVASLIVLALPGPGVVFVVTRSLSSGRAAGILTAAGLSLGAAVHAFAAALGLSAVMATSATAFTTFKMIGAAYLIYLGITVLLEKSSHGPSLDEGNEGTGHLVGSGTTHLRLVTDGIIVSLFNPKIALFFLAYLPQFVSTDGGGGISQLLLLGLLYAGLAFLTDSSYALMAAGIRPWLLRQRSQLGALPQKLTGLMFIALGVHAAFADRR